MKYTLEQLQAKTNTELDELCALARGWELVTCDSPSPFGIEDRPYWNNFSNPGEGAYQEDYHPTTNKEQAWDLMVKYICFPVMRNGIYLIRLTNKLEVEHIDLKIVATIAAILVAQEGEN